MPTVEEYKLGILRQLVALEDLGRDPVLPLQTTPSDTAIRAVAELEADRVVVFDDDSLACRLTAFGSRNVGVLIRELEMEQRRK